MRSNLAPSKVTRPRMPRQYAQLIMAAGSDNARAVLWAKVPTDWRAMVQSHITHVELCAQHNVFQKERLRPAVRPQPTPTYADYCEPVRVLGDPVIAAQHLAALRASIHSPRVSQ